MGDQEAVLRVRVNGTYLHKYIGKPVSIIGSVLTVTPNGTSVDVRTVENHVVLCNMRQPLNGPLTGIVEMRGMGQSKSSIVCDDYTVFPPEFNENFDTEGHNEAMTLIHSVPNPWIPE